MLPGLDNRRGQDIACLDLGIGSHDADQMVAALETPVPSDAVAARLGLLSLRQSMPTSLIPIPLTFSSWKHLATSKLLAACLRRQTRV